MTDTPALLLASSSPFRRQLLDKLGLKFIHQSPDIDESRLADESPVELVMRLAREKARALADAHPDTLIIGSDQVAVIGDQILGKPGTREKAIEQLSAASGQRVAVVLSGGAGNFHLRENAGIAAAGGDGVLDCDADDTIESEEATII